MTGTTNNDHAQDLVRALLSTAKQTEDLSRRNGWDTETQPSVYPGGALADSLLDIRATRAGSRDAHVTAIIDGALAEYGRRPGACTTAEVRTLCGRLLEALERTGVVV